MELNINNIIWETKVEGPGNRTAIWVQGCNKGCKGCFANHTWNDGEKHIYKVRDIISKLEMMDSVEGVTISGGEPIEQITPLLVLMKEIKNMNKGIILFTGNTKEELKSHIYYPLIASYVDVIKCGPFDINTKQSKYPMIGSSNQEFLFFTDRYSIEDFEKNKVEVRIKKDGNVMINGMENEGRYFKPSFIREQRTLLNYKEFKNTIFYKRCDKCQNKTKSGVVAEVIDKNNHKIKKIFCCSCFSEDDCLDIINIQLEDFYE